MLGQGFGSIAAPCGISSWYGILVNHHYHHHYHSAACVSSKMGRSAYADHGATLMGTNMF